MQPTQHRLYRVTLDGDRFYLEMHRRGWKSRARAAKELEIPEPTLSKVLSGKVEPSALTIDRLVIGLGVSYEVLFRREELS